MQGTVREGGGEERERGYRQTCNTAIRLGLRHVHEGKAMEWRWIIRRDRRRERVGGDRKTLKANRWNFNKACHAHGNVFVKQCLRHQRMSGRLKEQRQTICYATKQFRGALTELKRRRVQQKEKMNCEQQGQEDREKGSKNRMGKEVEKRAKRTRARVKKGRHF